MSIYKFCLTQYLTHKDRILRFLLWEKIGQIKILFNISLLYTVYLYFYSIKIPIYLQIKGMLPT